MEQETSLSQQTSLNTYTENLWPKVTSKAECSKSFLDLVARSHEQQIKYIPKPIGRVLIELPIVAKLYGARAEIDNGVLKECAKNVVERFSFLGIDEIKEAYRQYSTGEIIAKGADMYGGEFNASQLCKILGAYAKKRQRVLGVYLKEKEESREQAGREERARIMREAFDREFPVILQNARHQINDWRDVPAFWYQAAMDRGYIDFEPGEAQGIFEDAKELATLEISQENSSNGTLTLREVIERQSQDPISRAKVIARKLAVFRKIIQSDIPF